MYGFFFLAIVLVVLKPRCTIMRFSVVTTFKFISFIINIFLYERIFIYMVMNQLLNLNLQL